MKLKMDRICKSFGSNEVLKSVGFQLGEGEICALLGRKRRGQIDADEYSGRRFAAGFGRYPAGWQKRKRLIRRRSRLTRASRSSIRN